jgi:hypothetical protein
MRSADERPPAGLPPASSGAPPRRVFALAQGRETAARLTGSHSYRKSGPYR